MFRLKLLPLCSAVVLFHLTGVARAQIVPVSGNACDGTFAGTFSGNVTVAAGQTCHFMGGGIIGNVKINGGNLNLDGTSVSGNVQLHGSGNLVLNNATILGDVQIDGGGTFSIGFALITGSLHIQNIPAGPAQNQICGTTVTGNLQFKNNGTAIQIGAASLCPGSTVGGNLQVQNNTATVEIYNNTVNGDLQAGSNTSPILITSDVVGGNLQVQNNTGSTTVSFNNVQKNLQCQNTPLLLSGSNTAAQNQGCTTLPPSPSSSGPLILSSPPQAAMVGSSMHYQIAAASSSPASLVFVLLAGPTGMTIDSSTGLLKWSPVANQIGDQSVTIVVQDSVGQASQSFTISVFGANVIASVPVSAASGGVVKVTDPTSKINGLSINIPAGALTSDTSITVSELIAPPTLAGIHRFLLKGFNIGPDGTTLAFPATITISYSPDEFDTSEGIPLESFLGVYFLQTSTGSLEFLNNFSVDTVNHIVTGSVPHFSGYILSNTARLCPPPLGPPPLDCPSAFAASAAPILTLPTVVVHGFRIKGMGDETTWANLRFLLGGIDAGGPGSIAAWRFDWDSVKTSFEKSAGDLAAALSKVESFVPSSLPHTPNVLAHSFGGILVRTYLQGMATEQGLSSPYAKDVNRVMTLGTPHRGIGGDFSTTLASNCVADIGANTCLEADTGGGAGDFLTKLNSQSLPTLTSTLLPQYDIIIGQQIHMTATGPLLQADDGLITFEGADLCGADPAACAGNNVNEEAFAKSSSDAFGLCHSAFLINADVCHSDSPNFAMAAIDGTSHPLWIKICQFLGCEPAVNVTLSGSPVGTVASSDGAINCGTTCSALYPFGSTVTLTAQAPPGFAVTWSGCTVVLPSNACQVTVAAGVPADYSMPSGALFTGYPISVAFTPITFTLTVQLAGSGTGTVVSFPFGITCSNSAPGCSTAFLLGTSVRLRAIPTPGAVFASWSGDCAGTTDLINVVLSHNLSCTATFTQVCATTLAQPIGHGIFAFVANLDSNAISVIDTASNSVVSTIPCGPGPSGLAGSPDGSQVYVTNETGNTFSAIDLNKQVITTVSTATTSNRPFGVAVTPDGKLAYVSDSNGFLVLIFDTAAKRITGGVLAGSDPAGLAITPDGHFVYVANFFSNSVSVIDTTTNLVTATVPVGPGPNWVAITPNGAFAYVTNFGSNTVSVINTAANAVVATVTVGSIPVEVAISPDGGRAYVTNRVDNDVSIIDTATNTVLKTVTVGFSPAGVAVTPDSRFVYVANQSSASVSVIDTTKNSVSTTIPVQVNPFGIAIVSH